MPAAVHVDPLIRAVHDGRAAVAHGVGIGAGVRLVQLHAAALQIQHLHGGGEQFAVHVLAQVELGGGEVAAENAIAAGPGQGGEVRHAVHFARAGVVHGRGPLALEGGLAGLDIHHAEGLRGGQGHSKDKREGQHGGLDRSGQKAQLVDADGGVGHGGHLLLFGQGRDDGQRRQQQRQRKGKPPAAGESGRCALLHGEQLLF